MRRLLEMMHRYYLHLPFNCTLIKVPHYYTNIPVWPRRTLLLGTVSDVPSGE